MNTASLENQREGLLRELQELGQMRKGSLSERYQRCSRHPCVCHDRKHPGHGPIYSYSSLVEGKTKIRSYKPGPPLERLRKELAAYQRFRELTQELISVSTQLCEAREGKQEQQENAEVKKKLQKRSPKSFRRR